MTTRFYGRPRRGRAFRALCRGNRLRETARSRVDAQLGDAAARAKHEHKSRTHILYGLADIVV